jgi:hypothetical protein
MTGEGKAGLAVIREVGSGPCKSGRSMTPSLRLRSESLQ